MPPSLLESMERMPETGMIGITDANRIVAIFDVPYARQPPSHGRFCHSRSSRRS